MEESMATFNEIYLTKTPLKSTSHLLKGNDQRLTPLNEVQYLMIYAFQEIFNDIYPNVKRELTPSIVFGKDPLGNSKYLILAGKIMHQTEFFNDKYADENNIKNGMFSYLFTTPIYIDGEKYYLDIPNDMVYRRVNDSVIRVLSKNNYSFPISDKQIDELIQIFTKVFDEIIEGKKFVLKNGRRDYIPSELIVALSRIKHHRPFHFSDFVNIDNLTTNY